MKLTKREYTKQTNELTALIADFNLAIAIRIAKIGDRQVSIDEGDSINAMHDKVAELEQAIKDMERRWNTRNWTAGDWASYELVAANID